MRCRQLDSRGEAWLLSLADGREVRWEGFSTGPVELGEEEIEFAARKLLGLSTAEVPAATARWIRSSNHDGRCIVLHGATPELRNLQGDIDELLRGHHADDTATYMETRAVTLARPGDLVVGRTRPWLAAARAAGIETVVIPGLEYFYLSQALLRLMVATGPESPQVHRLVRALREDPQTVFRLYSMDLELQIALLYLRQLAGVEFINTDANSPEVSSYWNTKAPVYPRARDVVDLTAATPQEMLAAETEFAPMRQRLGLAYGRLPGYAFDIADADELVLAAQLMRSRYGLDTGCLKPSKGGGGARILTGFDLTDEAALRRFSQHLMGTHEVFLLEAQVDYATVVIGGLRVRLAPSAHIRHGALAEGLTLQLTIGSQWQGNIYLDRAAAVDIGLPAEDYDSIRQTVSELNEALGPELVTGGVDFAIGTVGGAFADHRFVAVQDPNLSSHGAEYLRRFRERVRAAGGPRYAATKVTRPTRAGDLDAVLAAVHGATSPTPTSSTPASPAPASPAPASPAPASQTGAFPASASPASASPGVASPADAVHPAGDISEMSPAGGPSAERAVICVVPGRWGMLAAAGASPAEAVSAVLAFEAELISRGLAETP